jgi:DNA-binding response OmpR family regulator
MSLSNAPGSDPAASVAGDSARPSDPLAGKRILLVEDDAFIMMALDEMLTEQGLTVAGTARSLPAALTLATSDTFDLALLDVNIGREKIDPVADALTARGCPFVFTTGCGRSGLPEAYLDRAIVEKPFYIEEILKALREELASNDSPREQT